MMAGVKVIESIQYIRDIYYEIAHYQQFFRLRCGEALESNQPW